MRNLFTFLSLTFLLTDCKTNEAPPQTCYVCTTTTTTISTLEGSAGTTTTTQVKDNVCGEAAKGAVINLGTQRYASPGLTMYLITKCNAKP
ncbi:hypothetical protein [Spirosoma sp.]|uniref:hypothetical protein n=1 Tax=Spirosoma sp. TaxID=1899569 RepID=UPI002626D87C|nr:hypothetical protein [Spirosoma sp.]MCX6217614.1 hypothetical protein [Spirosoma sp.]